MMGSDTGNINEQPVHQVTMPDFEIAKTEITVEQYAACVDAGTCTAPGTGQECNWEVSGREDHPVNCVNWDQAGSYCQWAGGRLPSEAEWEYAARSEGLSFTYPWGGAEPTCDYAVMDDGGDGCGIGHTMAVCSKTAGNTAHDLCDMAGNIGEWVQDRFHGSYDCDANPGADGCGAGGVAPTDGSAWDSSGSSQRVMRGGSWVSTGFAMRVFSRTYVYPSAGLDSYGFRCTR
jgi:iron(II)-dependent oxidoreductase